jgi:DNA primase
LYSAVAAAADWFARQLRDEGEAKIARDYLASRGLDQEQAGVLGLGYAPKTRVFLDAMKALGLKDEVLLEAGLLHKREDGSLVPRFRGRLLFPIHDLRGRVVAFGGRILGEGEPKYLNSPETPVFHKGQQLYNLHVAKHAIRKAERAILVEGYFDVVRLVLAGVEEVVAPLGTGLTSDQADLLKRHTSHVILLYDSDDAGLRATFRAGDELLRHSLRVSVATLPPGEDPDTLVRAQGATAIEALLKDALDLFERKIQILERRGFFGTLPGRRRALDRLLPTIRAAADPITRELYLTRASEVAGVRKDVLERETTGAGSGEQGAGGRSTASNRSPLPAPMPSNAEKVFLQLLLEGDPWRARVRDAVDPEDFEFPAYRTVYEAVLDDAPDRLDDTAARVYERLKAEGLRGLEPDAAFAQAVNWMEARHLDRELDRLEREIPLAQGDEQVRLVMEKKRLSAERNAKVPRYKITARGRGASGS